MERERPSRTHLPACSTVREIRGLLIELLAVSSEGTSGMPPLSNVASVRENMATWYFSQTAPKTGSLKRRVSSVSRPFSERNHAMASRTATIIDGITM